MGAKSSKIHLKNEDQNKDSSVKENNTTSSLPNNDSGSADKNQLIQETTGEVPLKNSNLVTDLLKDEEFWLDA